MMCQGLKAWRVRGPVLGSLLVGMLLLSAGALPSRAAPIMSLWRQVASPAGATPLRGIVMVSRTDGWIVGGNGLIMRWDGLAWSKVSSPVTTTLTAVAEVAPDDAWAVGQAGAIIHWDGSAWTSVASPVTVTLMAIAMPSAGQGWAVGINGAIVRWQNGAWSAVNSPTSMDLYTVSFANPDDGWAMGGVLDFANTVTPALHWDGQALTSSQLPDAIWSLDMTGPGTGWAVGYNGTCEVRRKFAGSDTWQLVGGLAACGSDYLFSLAMLDDTRGWAAGRTGQTPTNGVIYAVGNGGTWTQEFNAAGVPILSGIAALSPEDVWAVGDGGVILHRMAQTYLPLMTRNAP